MRNRQLLSLLLPLCAVVVATSLLIVTYDGPIRPLPEQMADPAGVRREIWQRQLSQAEQDIRNGNLAQAEERLRDFYREQPGNTRVLRLLIRISCLENRLDEAEKYCLELMNINPGNADVYSMLGHVYLLKGQPQAAQAALQYALTLDPKSVSVRQQLAALEHGGPVPPLETGDDLSEAEP